MNETGKLVVVSEKEGFLVKSLMSKLKEIGLFVVFSRADTTEMGKALEDASLILYFMGEETENTPETLVYLKDTIQDKEYGLILVGDQDEYDSVRKTIPEHFVTAWFQRPLEIDKLLKCVTEYFEANSGEKRKKNILIVDDDITYMRMVYEWLRNDYHVGMAANGVQAITYLANNKADLILLDYEMPIANGPQVFSMLKNDSETGQIPVMFLTGHGDKDSVLSVVGLKPADYLLKTISKEALLEKLQLFFKNGKTR